MRGNRSRRASASAGHGSIPAHAGEPGGISDCPRRRWVYPRACGGTAVSRSAETGSGGLSPRMRGNRCAVSPMAGGRRSIPAHAGEPAISNYPGWGTEVYPRACGGTLNYQFLRRSNGGLSPRMRGNRRMQRERFRIVGSIPAHAGEPKWRDSRKEARRVYPRACGGTQAVRTPRVPPRGLSPRMRGNPCR